MPPTSLLDGLTALFADWTDVPAPMVNPAGGRVPAGATWKIDIDCAGDDVRYTLDGSEPGRQSRLYKEAIAITGPAIVRARAFRGELAESTTTSAEFVAEPLQPAAIAPGLEPGLSYRYFERTWFNLPDDIDRRPDATGFVATVGLQPRRRDSGFVFEFNGYIARFRPTASICSRSRPPL